MIYNVRMTERAKEQMEAFVRYLVTELKNKQAASNLLEDVMDTEESLTYVAGSLPLCGDPDLHRRGDPENTLFPAQVPVAVPDPGGNSVYHGDVPRIAGLRKLLQK